MRYLFLIVAICTGLTAKPVTFTHNHGRHRVVVVDWTDSTTLIPNHVDEPITSSTANRHCCNYKVGVCTHIVVEAYSTTSVRRMPLDPKNICAWHYAPCTHNPHIVCV
uniref:ORF8 protein n=1 Tax=Bat Coronavirus HpHB20 TaxID=3018839 RepID=A0AA49EDN3_9NIDO|nr:ORF8 protein [Bat Coronavirus HpHB20]